MQTVIVIPARLGATRLPRKPLLPVGNLPLVVRVAKQARKVRAAAQVIVATDSREIAAVCEQHGERCVMTRDDHPSGTDRVAEVAEQLDAELIVNVQGDEPFIDPQDLESIIEKLRGQAADIVTLKRPISSREDFLNPNVVKVVVRDDNEALYFSRAPIPYDRAGKDAFAGAYRHIGVYGYTRSALTAMMSAPAHMMEMREGLEQLRALALGLRIMAVSAKSIGRGIDTQEDLTWANARVESLGEAAFP
jgi:3-deoxy-D-manno-octulosonate cytidylyltransferase